MIRVGIVHFTGAWSARAVLEALADFRYDATRDRITLRPAVASEPWTGPFLAGTGWGTATVDPDGTASLTLLHGSLPLASLALPDASSGQVVAINGTPVDANWDGGAVTFASPLALLAGDTLSIG